MDMGLRDKFSSLLISYSATKLTQEEQLALNRIASTIGTISLYRQLPDAPTAGLARDEHALHAEYLQFTLSLERKYGDGRFEERREWLDTILRKLENGNVNLDAVYLVLHKAVRSRYRDTQIWRQIDRRRGQQNETVIVFRNLKKWITRAGSLFREEPDFDSHEDRLEWLRISQSLATLDTFSGQVLAESNTSERLRRANRGRPKADWVHDARRELRKAGVITKGDREDLLTVVGLVSDRTK